MSHKKQQIAVLGATGSIGKQTLAVINEHRDQMAAFALTLHHNIDEIEEICIRFKPQYIGIQDEQAAQKARPILEKHNVALIVGKDCNEQIAALPEVDTVVLSITGMQATFPLLAAIEHQKPVALANKECIVCGGEWMQRKCMENHATIYPVDSEQSAIFQCLKGLNSHIEISKLILTASGGPFLYKNIDDMTHATPEEALKHPNWSMGRKISIDSATMINKGLEVMEASYLFDVPYDKIDVLIHPQSIVHSMVEAVDGTILAQLGCSDMRLPIQYALTYPNRIPLSDSRLDLVELQTLTFLKPDMVKFKGLALAYDALKAGGTAPAIYNAANEVAVEAFLQNKIRLTDIADLIDRTLEHLPMHQADSLETILGDDKAARQFVLDAMEQMQ